MIRLRLTHGLSHSNGYVSATWRNPIVTVDTEAAARYCVDSGFFEIIDGGTGVAQPGGNGVQEPPKDNPNGNTSGDENAAQGAAAPGQGDNSGADDEDELDSMTVNQLKVYAETVGIDLGKATKKADIIAVIRAYEASH